MSFLTVYFGRNVLLCISLHTPWVLPLQEAAQAHCRLESGHGQGKIVLVVREQTNDQPQR